MRTSRDSSGRTLIELRAKKRAICGERVGSGIYGIPSDIAAFVEKAEELSEDSEVEAVWVSINEIRNDFLPKAFGWAHPAVRNADIKRRKFLPLDFDPVKLPEFQHDSSSDLEKRSAFDEANRICERLVREYGFQISMVDSGNGYQGLVHVDLPVNFDTDALCKAVLQILKSWTDESKVDLDTSVCDRARVLKLPGTQTRKGREIEGRPWRRSALLHLVEGVTSLETLRKLVDDEEAQASTEQVKVASLAPRLHPDFNFEVFLQHYRIRVKRRGDVYMTVGGCIMAGKAHRGDPKKSGFLFDGKSLGWKCFSSDCASYAISDVIRKLNKTCKPYPRAVWLRDDERQRNGNKPFLKTDLGNAERLLHTYREELRFCSETQRWFAWQGTRWTEEDQGHVMRCAKRTVRGICQEALALESDIERQELRKHALKSENASRLRAMVQVAQSEPGMHVRITDFDSDLQLFNVNNGTVDLHTGKLRPHDPADLISKISPASFESEARCPRWEEFLDDVFGGDKELVSYLKRAVGYSLTGLTKEQVFFLLHGTGANGKSTFLDAIRYVFGEYAQAADFNTFIASDRSGPRNDLAKLKGARFVTAVESEDGKRLAESFVKQVTGGDMITARFLYGENFEFKPQFKLWLATNHRPSIRDTSEGMWRRIKLIPFTVQILPSKQDRGISEKLRLEAPGILRWALEGLDEWRNVGLGKSDSVRRTTAEYRGEEDVVGRFIEERCVGDSNSRIKLTILYRAFSCWAVQSGNSYLLTNVRFSQALAERGGFQKTTVHGSIEWKGLRLRTSAEELGDE